MPKFDYPYTIVPDSYRKLVVTDRRKNHKPIDDPLITDLLAGKTVIVDAHVPINSKTGRPFKNLYNFFNSRGYNLQVHLFDDIDRGIFRGLLVWAEKFFRVYYCTQCDTLQGMVGSTRPKTKGCPKEYPYHLWREKKEAA